MRPSHFILPLALSGLAIMSSCSTRPDDVLDEDALSSLLADLYVGEAYTAIEGGQYTATASLDSARKVLRQSTMQAHGVSQAQFDSTLSWYGHNLGRYSEVCEKVIDELKHRQAEAQNKDLADDSKTDSSNLWPSQPSVRLTPAQGERTINFDIEPLPRAKVTGFCGNSKPSTFPPRLTHFWPWIIPIILPATLRAHFPPPAARASLCRPIPPRQ